MENCTIYCKIMDLAEISRLLRQHFPASDPSSVETMLVHGDAGSLRFTPKVFRERGDDFCRLILSTCAFVERMVGGDADVKARLLSHVESCELALGVVAEPSFDSDERYNLVTFAVAKALDGVIFNGEEMLDASGATLMTVS